MIRDFTPRLYQQTILGTAASNNTLVVLPTGLGKTAIAFLLTAQRLSLYPNSKILMLSPTKPLCEQHLETFRKHLEVPAEKIVLFTGEIAPDKRELLWKDAQIVISTPQGLENDVINRRVRLEEISLLVIDEAHHATGDYPYVWLAQQYEKLSRFPRILAMTASPGSDLTKIREVCQGLKIERVEVRTEKDPDVRPYVQNVRTNWIKVDFPIELKKVHDALTQCKKSKLIEMQKLGFASSDITKGQMLMLQGELQKKISSGERDFEVLRSISLLAEVMKVEHAIELLETQGVRPLLSYFQKFQVEAVNSKIKAVKNLMLDENFKAAIYLTEELSRKDIQHPKLIKLKEIVLEDLKKSSDNKIIVFTQFRSSAEEIVNQLNALGIKNQIFVGQAKKNGLGMSQKDQKEILDRFRAGEFNLLIATSVAEEGLDIPKVDKVIFFEPIPSAIRSIQRRGRTGRLEKGEVSILTTNGTRDVGYRWSSFHKEKRMYRNLEEIRKEFSYIGSSGNGREDRRDSGIKDSMAVNLNGNASLNNYISNQLIPNHLNSNQLIPKDQKVMIMADHRDKNNRVVKELIELGIEVKTEQLNSADYLVSGRVGVELKRVPDFVASIIDGRLLDQARSLKQNFERAVIIIEGDEDIYSVRKVHANAIRGMLASIVLDFGVPILYTKNPLETAALLAVMARREQDKERDFSYHDRKPRSMKEQQEFFVSAMPGIGVQNARLLLENFGSIKGLVNASKDKMVEIKGIGEKTAERLTNFFDEDYKKE